MIKMLTCSPLPPRPPVDPREPQGKKSAERQRGIWRARARACRGASGGRVTHTPGLRGMRSSWAQGNAREGKRRPDSATRNGRFIISVIRLLDSLRGDAAEETAGGRASRASASSVLDALDEVGGVACRRAGALGAAPGPRTGCSIMRLYTSSSSPHTSWPRVTPPLPPRPLWLSLLPSRSSCISSSYCSSLYLVLFSPPPPFLLVLLGSLFSPSFLSFSLFCFVFPSAFLTRLSVFFTPSCPFPRFHLFSSLPTVSLFALFYCNNACTTLM